MNGHQPPIIPKDYYLGFNFIIDRLAIASLLALAQQCVNLHAKSITICVSSPGGAPDQALYAYEVLTALPVPVHTHAVGSVQSAAVTLFISGKRRTAAPGTNFLLHETTFNPAAQSTMRWDDLMGQAYAIERNDKWSKELLAKTLEIPTAQVGQWYRGQILRDTEFALKHGIIHQVQSLKVAPDAEFAQVSLRV